MPQKKSSRKSTSDRPPRPPRPPAAAATATFAGLLLPLVPAAEQPKGGAAPTAPLAHLNYADELAVKGKGLALFWQHHRLAGQPDPVIASPRPRGYRTTSKRRAVLRGSTLFLAFGDRPGGQRQPFVASPLEPGSHERIFRFLQRKLSEPAFHLAAAHLNHLIIRGSYTERVVIFNVDAMNGPLVRKFKLLADHCAKGPVSVAAAFVFLDPSRSDYYLESRRPETFNFKHLFGPELLTVEFAGHRYRYHPTSFSQVNEAMVPVMLAQARELLSPTGGESLLDLYCGYGLFSAFLAPEYRQVLGIDAEGPSIRAAVANGRQAGGRVRYLARRLTEESLDEVLAAGPPPDAVLLDPPRQGPLPGVIEVLSRCRPGKVLHIFCGVDEIPNALAEWRTGGYQVERVVPLDMFPGSANLEVLVLLTPRRG